MKKKLIAIFGLILSIFVIALLMLKGTKSYTVVFLDFDNTKIETVKVKKGKDAIISKEPVRIGYEFTNWCCDVTNVKSDLEVVAEYQVKTFTVRFNDYEGSTVNSQIVNYGESAIEINLDNVEGLKFIGWDKEFNIVKQDLIINPIYELINNSFGELLIKENIDKVIQFNNVKLVGKTKNGYYLSTNDSKIAFVNDIKTVPKEEVIYNIVAKVASFGGFLELEEINFSESNGNNYQIQYKNTSIGDVSKEIPPVGGIYSNSQAIKLSNVKLIVDETFSTNDRLQLFIVDSSFDEANDVRTKDNSILVSFNSPIYSYLKSSLGKNIRTIDFVLSGYREMNNIWVLDYLLTSNEIDFD